MIMKYFEPHVPHFIRLIREKILFEREKYRISKNLKNL